MLYNFAKLLMGVALRFFYKRVFVTGLETIGAEGPALIIANHPSSLMDAALLGILIKRPVHFFTRADVFAGGFTSRILTALNMIPVEHHAGRVNLTSNDNSFAKAENILLNGGIIVFFPEGNSHITRKLHPLKKGVFRLAFQTAAKADFKMELPVIPVGINYSHSTACQADVMVHFGTPLLVNDYKEEYLSGAPAALLHMAKDSTAALEKQVLQIEAQNMEAVTEHCLQIKRNNYDFLTHRWLQGTRKRYEEEKDVCDRINQLSATQLANLEEKTAHYFRQLNQYNIKDEALSPLFKFSVYKKLLTYSGFPIFIVGYLLNSLPLVLAKRIANKTVYRVDYYSWVYLVSTAFLHILWLLLLFSGTLILGWKYSAAICGVTICTGVYTHFYLQSLKMYSQCKRRNQLYDKHPAAFEMLVELRTAIISMI